MNPVQISSVELDEPTKIINLTTDGSIVHNTIIEGTLNYEELENKPSIDGNVLVGDMTLSQIGITAENLDITAESLGITPEDIGVETAGAFSIYELFG